MQRKILVLVLALSAAFDGATIGTIINRLAA